MVFLTHIQVGNAVDAQVLTPKSVLATLLCVGVRYSCMSAEQLLGRIVPLKSRRHGVWV